MRSKWWSLCVALVVIVDPAQAQAPNAETRARERFLLRFFQKVSQDPRPWRDGGLRWLFEREAFMRLLSILSGAPPTGDPGSGWLVPSRMRYSARWLLDRFDKDGDGALSPDEWPGDPDSFRILDRNGDGFITATDLDWSPGSPLYNAVTSAKSIFREIDSDGDGRIEPDEWQAYMDKLAKGRPHLTQDDLLPLFLPGSGGKAKSVAGRSRGGINLTLLKAFFEGDVASIFEGPRPGAPAPDFTLPTPDGKRKIRLSEQFGKRPTVLVFGSFT